MKTLITKLKRNEILKTICYWGIVVFLFLYAFSIPSFSGRRPWFILSYVFMAGFVGFTIAYTFLYGDFRFNKMLLIPASFVAFAFVGTAFFSHAFKGENAHTGWLTLFLMLLTLLFFYYGFNAINKKQIILKTLIFAFLLFGFYFAYVYRAQVLHLKFSNARLGGYFDNVNAVGFYFAIGYTLSLFTGLFFNRKIELLYVLPAMMFFVLGIFTGSRAFLVAVAAATLFIMYYKLRKHKLIFAIALGCLVGLYFVLLNIPQLAFLKDQFNRTIYTLFGLGNSKVDTSTIQRAVWPGYAFYLGARNLIIGYGVNGFSVYSGVGTYAHNNFAEVMCNFGIIGFLLFNSCFLLPLVFSFKNKEKEMFLVPILVAVYFFRSFFGVTYYTKEAYLIIAILFFFTKDCKLPNFKGLILTKKSIDYSEVDI